MKAKVIVTRKKTFKGYTRYPDRYFKNIEIVDHLLCDVDARKCPHRGKVKGREWCQLPEFGVFIKQGECRKVEIIIENKTHIQLIEVIKKETS